MVQRRGPNIVLSGQRKEVFLHSSLLHPTPKMCLLWNLNLGPKQCWIDSVGVFIVQRSHKEYYNPFYYKRNFPQSSQVNVYDSVNPMMYLWLLCL